MESRPSLLFLISLALLLHAPPTSADPASAPAPAPSDSDFIQKSCNLTLYPDICYTSLSRYASSISQSSSSLARAAITVSLTEAHFVSSYFSNLSRNSDIDSSRAALHDCASMISDVVYQIHGSLKQICQLGEGVQEIRFQISNVQTWMSAAITDEDTCSDGFEDVPDGDLKSDVCEHVDSLRMVTSNALALVNLFASTVN